MKNIIAEYGTAAIGVLGAIGVLVSVRVILLSSGGLLARLIGMCINHSC